MPEDNNKVTVFIMDAELLGLEDELHLEMPTLAPLEFSLIDHDNQECRIVSKEEIRPLHVDNEIDFIDQLHPSPWTLSIVDIDQQMLHITYNDGRTLGITLGHVGKQRKDFNPTRFYRQIEGIVFPIDENGNLLMDMTNAPLLSALRSDIHLQLRNMMKTRLEIAEITAIFAGAISNLGQVPLSF